MTVIGNEHMSDDELILVAMQLAMEKDDVIRATRHLLYRGAQPKQTE
jgi:hypothetical protein